MRRTDILTALLLTQASLAVAQPDASRGTQAHRDLGPCNSQAQQVITWEQLDRTAALTVSEALRRAPRQSPRALPECNNDDAPADQDAPSSG